MTREQRAKINQETHSFINGVLNEQVEEDKLDAMGEIRDVAQEMFERLNASNRS